MTFKKVIVQKESCSLVTFTRKKSPECDQTYTQQCVHIEKQETHYCWQVPSVGTPRSWHHAKPRNNAKQIYFPTKLLCYEYVKEKVTLFILQLATVAKKLILKCIMHVCVCVYLCICAGLQMLVWLFACVRACVRVCACGTILHFLSKVKCKMFKHCHFAAWFNHSTPQRFVQWDKQHQEETNKKASGHSSPERNYV